MLSLFWNAASLVSWMVVREGMSRGIMEWMRILSRMVVF